MKLQLSILFCPGIHVNHQGEHFHHQRIDAKSKKSARFQKKKNAAKFVCSMTLYWPNGRSVSTQGVVKGKISAIKKGKKGFGYDPIFIPDGYNKTFGQMVLAKKMSIDHRFKAFSKIKKFFT